MKNKTIRTFIQVLKMVIISATMLLLLWTGWKVGESHRMAGNIILAISLLITGWYIITLTHRLMQRNRWRLIGFTLLYFVAIWVYESLLSEDRMQDILAPINNTLSIFFPSRGSYSDTDTAAFHVIHLLSYLFFAMIAFSWFGRRLLNRTGYYFIPFHQKNIIWGTSEGSILLAKDILKQTIWQQVVFILPFHQKKDEELFELLDNIGAIVIYRDFKKEGVLPHAYRHFFLTEDQDLNLKMALRVFEQVRAKTADSHLYVNNELDGADRLFDQYEHTNTNVHIINPSEITAGEFIRHHHPLDMPGISNNTRTAKVDGTFNILQLGFGSTGREVLNKMICNSQYVGSTFKATIIDHDLNTHRGAYHILYKECIEEYHLDINPIKGDVGSMEFYDWINMHISEYNRIIVALGSDSLNLEIALTLTCLLKNKGCTSHNLLFTHIRNVDKYSYYKTADSLMQLFGDLSDIYSYRVIVNEELDILAKEMNWDWADPKHTQFTNAQQPWRKANIFSQDSSRSSAEGINNTLKLLGMSYSKSLYTTPISQKEFESILSSTLEVLAENEHLRWNAFHFTNGIQRWDYNLITEEEFRYYRFKANQVVSSNKHAALVPYAELVILDSKLNAFIDKWNQSHPDELENLLHSQDNDRQFVKDIPMYVAKIGCVISQVISDKSQSSLDL